MKKAFLWPAIFAAAVVDGCYDIFWYCVIVGRPTWMVGRKDPARAMVEVLGAK